AIRKVSRNLVSIHNQKYLLKKLLSTLSFIWRMLLKCSSASRCRNRAPAVIVFDIRQRRAMKLPRRAFLQLAAVAAVPRFAWAQAYPIRPVRTIVGLAAG